MKEHGINTHYDIDKDAVETLGMEIVKQAVYDYLDLWMGAEETN